MTGSKLDAAWGDIMIFNRNQGLRRLTVGCVALGLAAVLVNVMTRRSGV
jgi:hypothetical protein